MVRKLEGFGKAQGFDIEEYCQRIRIFREIVSGDNQSEFARRLGVDFKRWSNYERGYPIPREVAFLLRQKFPGMSIEWIWFGDEHGLSAEYKRRIDLAKKLDIERNRNLADLERAKKKLDGAERKRREALHPKGR